MGGCAQALIVNRLKRMKIDLANMWLLSTEFAPDPNVGRQRSWGWSQAGKRLLHLAAPKQLLYLTLRLNWQS
jgi:hypothetical protein